MDIFKTMKYAFIGAVAGNTLACYGYYMGAGSLGPSPVLGVLVIVLSLIGAAVGVIISEGE